MKKLLFAVLALLGVFVAPVNAQQVQALIVTTCGTPPVSYVAGTYGIITMDTTGKLCDSGSGGGGGTVTANQGTGGASAWLVTGTGGTFPVTGTFWPYTLGQQLAAASVPVVLTAAQLSTLTPPAAITGFALDASVATTNIDLGPPGATACATDTGSCSLNALAQRIAQRLSSQLTALGSPFQAGGSIANTTFAATQSGTWTVQPGNTANTTPWLVSPSASATGGATPYHVASAASNNSTNVKNAPGTVYDLTIIQTTTTLGDFRFYDSASAPTCSSATGVVNNLPVQSNAISPGLHLNYPAGKLFANGISFCYTGAIADNDNTNAATGVQIQIDYK